MDKILIASGLALTYLAVTNKHNRAIDVAQTVLKEKGFIGVMIIFAGLLTIQQYIPKYAGYSAMLGFIIMMGLYNKSGNQQ